MRSTARLVLAGILITVLIGTGAGSAVASPRAATGRWLDEATISQVRDALRHHRISCVQLAVTDLARVLDVMAAPDPADASTLTPDRRQPPSYAAGLTPGGLRGKRIGVLRSWGAETGGPGSTVGGDPRVAAALDRSIRELRAAGATVVDDLTMPGFEAPAASDRTLPSTREILTAAGQIPPGHPELARLTAARPVMRAMTTALLTDRRLDALLYPTTLAPAPPRGSASGQPDNCELASSTGLPAVVVPAGFTTDTPPLPLSIEFLGRAWSEARLLRIAYADEQRTHHRHRPPAEETDGQS